MRLLRLLAANLVCFIVFLSAPLVICCWFMCSFLFFAFVFVAAFAQLQALFHSAFSLQP